MNPDDLLAPAGRDRRLAWTLRAVVLAETGLLLWFGWQLLRDGQGGPLALACVLLAWLGLRLFVPLGSFTFKWVLGDWPAAERGSLSATLRAIALESWWMARLYYVDQAWLGVTTRRAADATRPPLVLVHGFACNAAVWRPLLRRADWSGRTLVAVSFEPTYRRFALQLEALDQVVLGLLAQTGATRVSLVGHSMGGLLIRAYAELHPQRIAALVSVAAPHHGTWFGNLVFGAENGPPPAHSKWLLAFNARTGEKLLPPALNLWTAEDNIVIPARGSRLAHTPEIKLDGLGHMAAIASAAGISAISSALLKLETTTFPRSDSEHS